jgi:hypothetical protein
MSALQRKVKVKGISTLSGVLVILGVIILISLPCAPLDVVCGSVVCGSVDIVHIVH